MSTVTEEVDHPSGYTLVVHDEDGWLWAEVPELPGCFASGDSMSELLAAADEAIEMYGLSE